MTPESKSIVDIHQACLQKLHHLHWKENGIEVYMLRIDRIHPVISGNKWFKLKYHLKAVVNESKKGILTFGGAWSNHILAVAHVCNILQIESVGVIRGEQPATFSPTLLEAQQAGMRLIFIPRAEFSDLSVYEKFSTEFNHLHLVPEGAADEMGIKGAEDIMKIADVNHFSHIMTAAGTGTMSAGILRKLNSTQQLLVISALKFPDQHNNSLTRLLGAQQTSGTYQLLFNYHFGGYAKYNHELIRIMNDTYGLHQIPTDFIYTAKMFYGFLDLVNSNYFMDGSKVLLVHSGGLQGNRSLSERLTYQFEETPKA